MNGGSITGCYMNYKYWVNSKLIMNMLSYGIVTNLLVKILNYSK